jgi:putative ABC transport system permease protein
MAWRLFLRQEDPERRLATLDLGGLEQVKEACRDERRFSSFEAIWRDMRYALRGWRRNPAFTVAAVLTLALGIGANTAIFSIVDGVLLKPAPFANMNRLVMIWETDRKSDTTREPGSIPDFVDYQARSRAVQPVAALIATEVNLAPPSGEPLRLATLAISHDMLPMLGISPLLGRGFRADEDTPQSPRVAMVSESLWRGTLNADPDVVGSTLRFDDQPFTVLGVVPDTAEFGALQILSAAAYSRGFADRGERTRVDVWLPLLRMAGTLPRDTHPAIMLGRLAPGATVASAQDELGAIAADLERTYPVNDARGVHVEALDSVVLGSVRPMLYVLLCAVGLVLLVAAVNVAGLLLARGAARAQEIAVRMAIGASRGRLARQFLVETLLLSGAAAVLGIAGAVFGLRWLLALAPADIPRLGSVALDSRVLTATILTTVTIGAVFGFIPVLQAPRSTLQQALHSGSTRGTAGPRLRRARAALVVAELAMAVTLLAGAGLLIRSFWNLLDVNPGFNTAGVAKAEFQLPQSRYPVNFADWPNFKEQHAFIRGVVERAATIPGVMAAAVAGNHPAAPGFTNSFAVVGREAEARNWPEISVRQVTPGYFATVGLALRRGRLLEDGDALGSPFVCLINEAAARRFFPDQNPIGSQIRLWGDARTIVGVVADEKFQGLNRSDPIAMYTPLAQVPTTSGAGTLLVRTAGDPAALLPALRDAIHAQDPQLAVFGVETLERAVTRSVSQQRFAMALITLFGGLALLLAAVGVHGVLSYDVAQRRREIGIRLALGAKPSEILRLIVGEGLVMTAFALAVGLTGAFALTRFLSTLLFGVGPHDPATLTLAAATLAFVALAATAWPAWRASQVDPIAILKAAD